MVKQRGLRQSNQKELTQKGDEHKKEKQSPRAEQQAQHSKQNGVLPCRLRWLGWRRVGPTATLTTQRRVDGQVVWRPRFTELPGHFEPSRRFQPPSRYEPSHRYERAALASSPRRRRSRARRRLSKPGRSS